MIFFSVLLALMLCFTTGIKASEGKTAHLYVTGTVMEIDRCASAWLLKRHVDEEATFDFLTDQELMVTEGFSFDTPFSEFRRTHTQSTFESIQKRYSLNDNRVVFLAKLIHELEINFWNKNIEKKAAQFQFELKKLLQDSEDNSTALQRCFDYLDTLKIEKS
jgi:hypothetical protein